MNAKDLPAYLDAKRRLVEERGPRECAYAMAEKYHERLSDQVMVRYSHEAGTPTPSPAGVGPPALIKGHLKRSLRLFPAIPVGSYRAMAKVIPLIVYARIQELGGTITAKNVHWKVITDKLGRRRRVLAGLLHWVSEDGHHFAVSVTLPKRPYMRPTRDAMIRDGSLRRAAVEELARILHG